MYYIFWRSVLGVCYAVRLCGLKIWAISKNVLTQNRDFFRIFFIELCTCYFTFFITSCYWLTTPRKTCSNKIIEKKIITKKPQRNNNLYLTILSSLQSLLCVQFQFTQSFSKMRGRRLVFDSSCQFFTTILTNQK